MYKSIIVDDEKNIRERMAKHFPWGDFNFEVAATASNGLEALALIDEHQPNLVMTDIKMPKMDGLELVKVIREKYPEIVVIILTAYRDFDLAQDAINNNVKGYLVKPIMKSDFSELMTRITEENDFVQVEKDKEPELAENEQKFQIKKSNNRYVTFAIKYVQDHYAENITLKDVADLLFIHEAYFSKVFNVETGVGFNAFVNYTRIENAKRLVIYSDNQLKEVSGMVGFSSHSYFNRVFKQMVGESPLSYRKKYFAENDE